MATNYDTWIEGDCGYDDAAAARDEARDEYIDDNAPALAKKLLGRDSFAEGVLNDLSNDVLAAFATDLGTFFERYHNAETTTGEAEAGHALYRTLKPYIEAAALEQAKTDAGEAFDKAEKSDDTPRSHAEACAMLGAA